MIDIDTLTDGTQHYDQRVTLDGTEFLLTLQWLTRRETWLVSLTALDGTPVLTGQTVVVGVPLNRRAVGGPPGVLIAGSETSDGSPPGLTELGGRVVLSYVTADELEGTDAE